MAGTGRGYGDIQKAKLDDVSSFVLRDNDNTDHHHKGTYTVCYMYFSVSFFSARILAIIVAFSKFFVHPRSYVGTERSNYSDKRTICKRVAMVESVTNL